MTQTTEHDLATDIQQCGWMLEKVRSNDTYAQNLYAAMCNNRFQPNQMWPRLRDEYWSCTWRSAGAIIAELQGTGSYMDWYCSGTGSGLGNGDPEGVQGYVGESIVTDEIRQDLFAIGWLVEPYPED